MIVLDVLKLMAQYLCDPELKKTTLLGGEDAPNAQQTEKVNNMIESINDTVQNLAIMYFPLKKEEVVASTNGVYSFNLFSKPLLEILKIVDNKLKYSVDYVMFPEHFEAKVGSLFVTYTYLPADVASTSSTLEVVNNKVTARMVALGSVSRYYLTVGMYQDASNWNQMFERAVLVAQRRKDNIVLKKRRWL